MNAGLVLLAAQFALPTMAQIRVPNPYGAGVQWGRLPTGRHWGSTSAIYPDRNRSGALTGRIWVAERYGGGHCRDSDLDPVLLFDANGSLVRSFSGDLFLWPHGIHVDQLGNVWVTDAVHTDCEPDPDLSQGHQVHKFSPAGELLMGLGKAGTPGNGMDTFRCPSDVVVSQAGDIFVGDGHNHGHGGNNRIVKFTSAGEFIEAWGGPARVPGNSLAFTP